MKADKYAGRNADRKVLLYQGGKKLVERSGVGRALEHQKRALEAAGISYTLDPEADHTIVHLNTVFPDSLWMSLRARAAGKTVIYFGHSTREDFRNSFPGSNAVSGLFRKWIEKCYSSADLVITPTPYSRRLLEGYRLRTPVTALSNGIDLDVFQKDAQGGERFRRNFDFRPSEKIVLGVGHYMERKGILDFVDMAERFPRYRFVWFGYTPPALVTKKVKRALKKGKELSNLLFPGYADRQALLDAYSGSDLFFFPTMEETEGIVMLEAMAMRLPILVRDIPVYEDWLEHGRSVYKGKTQEEFASLLCGILEGKLADLTEEAYGIVQKNSIVSIGAALADIYEGLESRSGKKESYENLNYHRLV
ncbi:MAG TPA: glycosyltransferase family 4 protein [Candidatus Eisenbergiella merdipullorum]|uniref:Glycosyltransferase family 4 protein n=1 Tax=Candidatus Eisenbergiella merdipullorum TaxID=2838553 RepID=A0A9D2I531_9FIRM|nr:glycosyltransferase family 4 protein [Candidatus Eisenbergiella merdipullorum]